LISQRTREGLLARKQRGEKYTRWPEYGWRWAKRLDPRLGKHVNVRVPDEPERVIMRKVVELRATGLSFDQIRQRLSYVLKVHTRTGGEWSNKGVALLFKRGLGLMADGDASDTEEVFALAEGEEDYDGLPQLEDECA
jgi:hypothetical protein